MPKPKITPAAFLSYVHDDDVHERGRITEIRERLSSEVKMQTGVPFPIFQDRNDIAWGQNWKARIDGSINTSTFFIPIITPSFFNSPACCDELVKFAAVQKKIKRNDLILPIYYVTSDLMDDAKKREKNKIAKLLHSHQFTNWRELRFKPVTDTMVSQAIAELAIQIKESIGRILESRDKVTKRAIKTRRGPITKKGTKKEEIETKIEMLSEALQITHAGRDSVQRTDVKTIVVDVINYGDFSTINAAIKAAEPGSRIMVRPGIYDEALVIDKPIELIGEGDRDNVTIQTKDQSCIKFITSMGKISNLRIKQNGGGYFAIDIAQGRLEIEDCDISSMGLSCIGVHDWADPRIRRNKIKDSKQAGILFYDNGQGTVENNDIFSNTFSGIAIKSNSNPVIRQNRIRDGLGSGVFVYKSGLGTIEDNDIVNNKFSGIEIKENANPSVLKNRIKNGQSSGIYIHTDGLGIIEENEVVNNSFNGIYVYSGSNPTISKNIIIGNIGYGIQITGKGKGKYEGNIFADNTKDAWFISTDSKELVSIKK